jgi:sugar lactone lactonase YvrE
VPEVEVLLASRAFLEGPRWRADGLYLSDILAGEVLRVGLGGDADVVAKVARPSGLGFLPDGRLLIVAMDERRVYRREADGSLAVHGDCSALTTTRINDMVVDRHGHAFVGQLGFDRSGGEQPRRAPLLRVDPDGTTVEAGGSLLMGNGLVVLTDERTLVVAEQGADCLTAFDLDDDGAIGHARPWASLPPGSFPDGICADIEDGVWVALLHASCYVRVAEGSVTDVVDTPGRLPVACALGGEDGRTLFMATMAEWTDAATMLATRPCQLETTTVKVPGCERP